VINQHSNGEREFNALNGINWGDPDYGVHKALFIVWENQLGLIESTASVEQEQGIENTITLP
jgi:hypothetical protein